VSRSSAFAVTRNVRAHLGRPPGGLLPTGPLGPDEPDACVDSSETDDAQRSYHHRGSRDWNPTTSFDRTDNDSGTALAGTSGTTAPIRDVPVSAFQACLGYAPARA
jgi:hypothetical protein